MTRLWMIRLGRYGEGEASALETGVLATGWELPDLSGTANRDDILAIVRAAYPHEKPGTLESWSVQLNQLKNAIREGDFTLTPLKTSGQIAVGRVMGGYVHSAGENPARRVTWLRTDLPRDAVRQDLLYSLGASQTICEISRNDALRRFEALFQTGKDPGPTTVQDGCTAQEEADTDGAANSAIDLAEIAEDQIVNSLKTSFSGHALTELIAAILRAQGYSALVSPPGADRGIDIVAGRGALGFDGPKLVVQVKSGDRIADQPTLQSLLGCIQDTHAQYGLLVSWAGFTRDVQKRANELYFRVRLWSRRQILDALYETYPKLPEEVRKELPLKQMWTLVLDDGE